MMHRLYGVIPGDVLHAVRGRETSALVHGTKRIVDLERLQGAAREAMPEQVLGRGQRVAMRSMTGFVLHNVKRSPVRGAMTVVAVAICLVAFLLIRTVSAGWTDQVAQTPDNRVLTRHKMGWLGTLPVHYVDTIAGVAGVRRTLGVSWGGLALPIDRLVEFESIAVQAEPFVAMHHEIVAPDAEKQAFIAERRGAMVSAELAEELGWKVGDIVHFKGANFTGDIVLTISSIFGSSRRGFARRSVYYHWEYYNEMLLPSSKDRVNLIVAEVEEPRQGAQIARTIDVAFENGDNQTFSQEDQAVNAQLVGEFGAILSALDFVSVLILGIVSLVLGNTLAMTARERQKEYGTLRAIGFLKKHVIAFIMGEAALLGLAGGVLGLALAVPLVGQAASRYLSESTGLQPLDLSLNLTLLTLLTGAAIGAAAGLVPALQLTRTHVVDSLRRVG